MKGKRMPNELEASWVEKDMAGGEIVNALVLIMRTNGCCWAKSGSGGCTMCGYRTASLNGVTEADLNAQIDQALAKYKGEPFVKIYTSGSFFDPEEIPVPVRERVFREFAGCRRLLVESRPEFITDELVASLPKNITVALGLESSNEEILRTSINKGFTAAQSKAAGERLKAVGLMVRTYLLLKPPFMSEKAGMDDVISSVRFAGPFSDEISINPLNIQHGTYVERLWKRGDFRPPWIWSLMEVMKKVSGTVDSRIISSPSGGGSQRGVHNCGKCDAEALAAVERFSFSQNPSDLNVVCECRKTWEQYLEAERYLGTAADIGRAFDSDLTIRM
jgi:radical SAM enzyme (TIGR01210 family)